MSDSKNKGCGCGCLFILFVMLYPAGALRSCLPEKASVAEVAKKAPLPEPLPTEKVQVPQTVGVTQDKSSPSPSKTAVPLSLNDTLSLQEQSIQQKVDAVLDLLGQLKQKLEAGGAGSKDEIRSRLITVSETARECASDLKASSELGKLRAEFGRLDEETRQNTRLSAAARSKIQELLLAKSRELERVEKLSADSIKKLSEYEDLCDGWLSDFDTLWKIDGLQQASQQLLTEIVTAFKRPSTNSNAAPPRPKSKANSFVDPAGFIELESLDGRKMRAKIVAYTGKSIVIRREDGPQFDLPLNTLSESALQKVSEWRAAKRK